MHGTWDFNLQYTTVHYSAHYMQRAIPILERTPCRKFLHRSLNFKVYPLLVTAFRVFFPLLRDYTVILSFFTGESEDYGFLVEMKSLQKLLINAVITATGYRYIDGMFQKEKRKGCCTYSWPVSVPCLWTSWCQSLGVGLFGFFSWIFFPPFCFFSVLFLWVSQSKRAISPALSVWTPSHMRTARNLPAASARKSLGRFITLIWTWSGQDVCVSWTSPFRVRLF